MPLVSDVIYYDFVSHQVRGNWPAFGFEPRSVGRTSALESNTHNTPREPPPIIIIIIEIIIARATIIKIIIARATPFLIFLAMLTKWTLVVVVLLEVISSFSGIATAINTWLPPLPEDRSMVMLDERLLKGIPAIFEYDKGSTDQKGYYLMIDIPI